MFPMLFISLPATKKILAEFKCKSKINKYLNNQERKSNRNKIIANKKEFTCCMAWGPLTGKGRETERDCWILCNTLFT